MTITLAGYTLKVAPLDFGEFDGALEIENDTWANGVYKRDLNVYRKVKQWRLRCFEDGVEWDDSAVNALETLMCEGPQTFVVDMDVLHEVVSCLVYILHLEVTYWGDNNRIFDLVLQKKEDGDYMFDWDVGLVLYMPLNTGTGSAAYDMSEYDNHGIIAGATWTEGKYGGGLSFDGVNDQITVTHNGSISFPSGDFSVSCWIKTSTDFSGANVWIIGKRNATENYALIFHTTNKVLFEIYDGVNAPGAYSTDTLNDGEWHHLVGVRDTSIDAIYLYVDGVATSAEDTTTTDLDNASNLLVGVYAGAFYTGLIDEIRIYNRALSAAEVLEQYQQSPPTS